MKSLFIILFSLASYGATRYVFSPKRVKKQITKDIKIALFVRHFNILNIAMALVGLVGFIIGLVAILYESYWFLLFAVMSIDVALFYYYSVLGRMTPNAVDDLGMLSDFEETGFCITRTSIYDTKHIGKIHWEGITKVYFNESKTALLMDSNLEQPYIFPNQIENWKELLEHIPERFGVFEVPNIKRD